MRHAVLPEIPSLGALVPNPFGSDVEEILSLVGDGVVSISRDGHIILVNRAAELLFGYASSELLGSSIEVLIPNRFRGMHRKNVAGFVDAAATKRHSMGLGREVLGRHKDGTEFSVEATLSTHIFAGQQVFMAVVRDITERKIAEQQRHMVAGEVAHRLSNTMALVSSIVSLTARRATSVPEFVASLLGRLAAVSRTNDALVGLRTADLDLRTLLQSELAAFDQDDHRFALNGPIVLIEGKLALNLGLIFHELATNAAKYGALSNVDGKIHVDWRVDGKPAMLDLTWQEISGPAVLVPTRSGFGSRVIGRILDAFDGKTSIEYLDHGVSCRIVVQVSP